MSSPLRLVFGAVLVLLLAFVAIQVVEHLLGWVIGTVLALVFHIVVPVLIVVGLAYLAYRVVVPRSLSGGRRLLP